MFLRKIEQYKKEKIDLFGNKKYDTKSRDNE